MVLGGVRPVHPVREVKPEMKCGLVGWQGAERMDGNLEKIQAGRSR